MISQQIGPYRIESSLGRGGMGEVFRAFDTRLERWVAVKVIRVDRAEESDVLRERFKREARAAAALAHPAIVQIHDIRSHEGADYIVMELVEGQTLAHRLAAGPMDALDVVRIARQVVGGLAAAHDLGIVHRDLKPDNIMVTSSGHAKILDFGLAKRVAYSTEHSLTEDGGVIGTWHAMAPEQARGLEVDHRADLFSLGVLLYQAVTGERPFRGNTPVETLTKVCIEAHRPAELWIADLPPDLCRLIDHLLQKDPSLRPRSAHTVAATLDDLEAELKGSAAGVRDPSTVGSATDFHPPPAADWAETWSAGSGRPNPSGVDREEATTQSVVGRRRGFPRGRLTLLIMLVVLIGAAAFVLLRVWPAGPTPLRYVAVLSPRLGTIGGVHPESIMTAAMRVALERGVMSVEGAVVVPPDKIDSVTGDSVAVGRAVAADEVVTSELTCGGGRCQATVHRIDVVGGGLLSSHAIEVPRDNLIDFSSLVSRGLQVAYDDLGTRSGLPALNVRADDYDTFLQVGRAFRERPTGASIGALLDQMGAIRSSSPGFFEGALLEAEVARYRFQETRNKDDLERASNAITRARGIAPADPRVWFTLARWARTADRVEDWEFAIRELEALGVTDATVDVQRALLLERRGVVDQALTRMQEAVRQHPAWFNRFELANLHYRQGSIAAARRQLEAILETQPDHFLTESFLAQLELLNGSPERAAELYEALVDRSSGITELSNLGVAYLLLGRYGDASACFEQVVRESPETPFALLNLADATYLEGRHDEALARYQQVYALATADPAASSWQMLTIRAQALAHLGSPQPAAALAQEALAIAGDNPQATYEAALVYALVGDRMSALVNAERAVTLGTDVRWFAFPWFDPLREEPSFNALLATSSAQWAAQ